MTWLRRLWKPASPFAGLASDGLEVIVPVCNAAGWIGVILSGYEAFGLRPLFILDERSADQTATILARRGARVMIARGTHPRVESLLYDLVPRMRHKWMLRFDDDEMPSRALLAWVAANLDACPAPAAGFPRRWVWQRRPGDFVFSHCAAASHQAGGTETKDRQYRLFRPADVTLTDDIHTPGFIQEDAIQAPLDAVLYHFDWLVRDRATRARKVANYEAQSPGNGARFAAYYLPEDRDPAFYDFSPLNDREVVKVAKRLSRDARL